ncbi:MAG: DUF4349 domain-containing protein [Bacillota bacterium]|nr:DUF4349 domain-containing protein [Bacillota bacterium]
MKTGMKLWAGTFTAMLLAFALVACASEAARPVPDTATRDQMMAGEGEDGYYDMKAEYAPEEPRATNAAMAQSGSAAPVDKPADFERKVITRGDYAIESTDVVASMERLTAAAAELGGYVESQSLHESRGAWYGELTVRFEAGREREFRVLVEEAGTIRSESTSAEDITSSYYDVEARLRNARSQEERLLEMYRSADSVEDMVYIASQLDTVQERIEQFEGQIRLWDHLVGLSTVNIRIYSEASVIPEGSETPRFVSGSDLIARIGQGLHSTAVRFVNGVANLLVWLSENLLQLIVLLAVAFGGWRLGLRFHRRWRTHRPDRVKENRKKPALKQKSADEPRPGFVQPSTGEDPAGEDTRPPEA